MSETVSVVIAARHGGRFIAGQLRSLFAQTRVPDEILLADDDPAGETAAVAETLRGEVPPGTCFVTSVNPRRLGVNGNMRQLMHRAAGDIIFFCDQDDEWLPDKIAHTLRVFRGHPELQLVHSLSEEIGTDGSPRRDAALFRAVRDTPKRGLFAAYLSERIVASGHDTAIRSGFRKLVPEECPPWLYDGLMAKTAAALDAVSPLGEVLCRHRLHGGNTANCELLDNDSVTGRWRQLRGPGSDGVAEFARALYRFERAAAALDMPERNREFLMRFARYFRRRVAVRKRRNWRRLFPGCALWREYFALGRGWRSYLRDAFLKQ